MSYSPTAALRKIRVGRKASLKCNSNVAAVCANRIGGPGAFTITITGKRSCTAKRNK
jgi:hypothetical protein